MTTETTTATGTGQDLTTEKVNQLRELFADAPEVGKKALENVLGQLKSQTSQKPPPPVQSAGRTGARLGKVSELTIIVPFAPGGAQRLRAFLQLFGGNLAGADDVGTVHDMRFVFLDNDTRMLFATAYDGDWDAYIDDFASKIPDFLDIIDSAWLDWPGIRSPQAKDYLAKYQVTAEGWYVANDLTVAETHRLGGVLPRAPVTVELDDIQATVLRYRPEPYYGTHVMLHIEDAQAGREFLRRLTPHVDSAAEWWQASQSWISVAITYPGLVALGVPEVSLRSFPDAFRSGMAAQASQLLDAGENDPAHWEAPFGTGLVHLGVSVFSDSEPAWHQTMEMARKQYEGFPGVTVLIEQDFGAQPGDLNPLGYKDSIGQPAIDGCGVDALPGQGPSIKAGEFILGYPGETGVPLPMPQPDVLGRNGTYAGLRKYQSRVGTFNRFLREHARTEEERELLAAKLVGRWRSGAPLTLAPDRDDPELGADPRRNNDFGYATDPHGRQVPLGCHMRRMNPRDTEMAIFADVNVHRIIRRSTTYGAPYDPGAITPQDDETPRGLYFIFLSAKAMATLEFLQREWINDGNFMNLGTERDPTIGLQPDDATFTIPQAPVRRRIHGIETFNVLRGGEYFFLPSLSALRWLGKER